MMSSMERTNFRIWLIRGLVAIIALATICLLVVRPWQHRESVAAQGVECQFLWTDATDKSSPFYLRPTASVVKLEHSRQYRKYGDAYLELQYLADHPQNILLQVSPSGGSRITRRSGKLNKIGAKIFSRLLVRFLYISRRSIQVNSHPE